MRMIPLRYGIAGTPRTSTTTTTTTAAIASLSLVGAFATAAAVLRTASAFSFSFSTTAATSRNRVLVPGTHRQLRSISGASRTIPTPCGAKDAAAATQRRIRMMSLDASSAIESTDYSSMSDNDNNNSSSSAGAGVGAGAPTLEALCVATLRASEAVTPAVEALYRSIGSETDNNSNNNSKTKTKTKADDSVFTIADGLVQHLLTETFLGRDVVGDIVGEEDCPVNLSTKPYTVDDLIVPSEFEAIIDSATEGVAAAREALLRERITDKNDNNNNDDDNNNNDSGVSALHPSLTAFVDPIDGTREFSTQKGEQCSICVGFSDSKTGRPVAGVVYRPLSEPGPTWAAGAASEGYAVSELLLLHHASTNANTNTNTNANANTTNTNTASDAGSSSNTDSPPSPSSSSSSSSLLTTNGSISPFLQALMDELGCDRTPSGGAGNKMLMLLEASGSSSSSSSSSSLLYIQDRGVSRWDTCAAQAVLEAHGGILCRLDRFLEGEGGSDGDGNDNGNDNGNGNGDGCSSSKSNSNSYTYRKTETNPDFVPGLARLTKYNAASDAELAVLDGPATTPSEVKPYANVCGLVALSAADNTPERRAELRNALLRAAERSPPAYD